MPEEPLPQQLQGPVSEPNILGPIDLETAQMLGQEHLDEHSMQVLEELGATALEGTPAYALVMGKDEETGADVPSHYIVANGNDIGTRVRPQFHSEFGLPGVGDAHATLIAKQQAAEAAQEGQAQVAEVEPKPEHVEGPVDRLADNPDELLRNGNLTEVLVNQGQSLLAEGGKPDVETIQKLEFLRQVAQTQVINPEAATIVAKKGVERVRDESTQMIAQANTIFTQLNESVKASGADFSVIMEMVPTTQRFIYDLRDNLRYGQSLDPGMVAAAQEHVKQFIEQYDIASKAHRGHAEDTTLEAGRLRTGMEGAAGELGGHARRAVDMTEETFVSGTQIDVNTVASAVEARGASSIAAHRESCETEMNKTLGASRDLSQMHDSLGIAANELARIADSTGNVRMVNMNEIDTTFEFVNHSLRQYQYEGDSYANMVGQSLDQLEGLLRKVEQAIVASENGKQELRERSQHFGEQLSMLTRVHAELQG